LEANSDNLAEPVRNHETEPANDAAQLRAELHTRFAAAIAAAGPPARPDDWPPFALPAPLRESIVAAAARNACPPALIEHYATKMPSLLVDQLLFDDEPRRLLCRPLEPQRLPRLRQALDGLFAALAAAGIDAHAFVGAPSPAALLAARPTLAAIYAHTLFGSGLPLVGAYPTDRPSLLGVMEAHGADEAIDRLLGCHIVHELCHGPARACDGPPAPWMVAEAAANHLGAAARAADIFVDEPGTGLRAVAPFVLLGDVLARRCGAAALWRLSLGAAPAAELGASIAAALDAAAWEDWLARREPPFARDALGVLAWIKLVDGARAGAALGPAPLAAAALADWSQLPWWSDAVTDDDRAMVPRALTALFQVNALAPDFRTVPSEPPRGRLWLDVAEARLFAEPRPDGVYGEPAWWLMPPSMARRLHERGARRVRISGATRPQRAAIAEALVELVDDQRPLPSEVELSWRCSR
jgi:hypothetical protein